MDSTTTKAYDYIVIGGGSGGSGGARRASKYGAKTLLVENGPSGGTCINFGCRPKIVTWNFASFAEAFHDAKEYGYSTSDDVSFDYRSFKLKRDEYVKSQSALFESNWKNDHVEFIHGTVAFTGPTEIEIKHEDGQRVIVTAPHICVAAGGYPTVPKEVPGAKYGITHENFFDLDELPRKIAIIGAGYIATEFAGILNALGIEVHLYIRGNTLLRNFDPMIQEVITKRYEDAGVQIHKGFERVVKVEKLGNDLGGKKRLRVVIDGSSIEVDELLWAIGRAGQTADLKLDRIGILLNAAGQIITDEYQNTSMPGIYAVGDVTGRKELQPVALEAGRQLADRLFGGAQYKNARVFYDNIPTVVFSHPEVGTIGLTEPQARKKFGSENVKTYHSKVSTMRSVILTPKEKAKHPAEFKIVCEGPDEKIVGLHMLGSGTSEILQGFAVAVNMGATKKDFNRCLPIHPTTAEALVTM